MVTADLFGCDRNGNRSPYFRQVDSRERPLVNETVKRVILLTPREELRLKHFVARAVIYTIGFFLLNRIFVIQILLANILGSLFAD